MAKKWRGRNAAVLASGPSMTEQDAIAVRDAGFITIAVNSTWKLAPWCDVLYAGDARWWKAYGQEVNIPAKRFCRTSDAWKTHKAKYSKTRMHNAYNSGQMAIEFAINKEPDLIVLLGFDCSVKNGIHHFGPHKKTPNPNPERARRWLPQFERINETYPHANIVNCSRFTEIAAFPKEKLEHVLARLPEFATRRPEKA